MDSLNIRVRLEEQDLYNFSKSLYFMRFPRVLYYVVSIGGLLAMSVLIINMLINNTELPGYAFVLFTLMLILLLIPLTFKISSKKAFTLNKLYQYHLDYELSEDGFKISSEVSNSFIKWGDFYKYYENKAYFYLFISPQQAYLIPKRYIKTGEEADFIRSCFNKFVKKPKEKLNKWVKGLLIYILIFIIILIVLVYVS